MGDNSELLVTLVIALSAGFIGAVIAARLGQSVVIGYLVAGALIGPYTPGLVADVGTVDALANVGVILLLFTVGVQLSFRDLMQVGKLAMVGGLIQVVLTLGVGYGVGQALGWTTAESLFLGAVVSNSSSTVMSKVLGDRGEVNSRQGRIGIAWSSVQDFSTIVLVIILGAISSGSEGSFDDLGGALLKAGAFLLILIPMGAYVFPWFFTRISALRMREVLVLAIAGVAFGTAYVSSFFGLSLALGAFAAGVAVAESDESHNIMREIMPLRDIFAAIFFVSIGMLVQPEVIVDNFELVLLIIFLTIVVKGVMCATISATAGVPAATAIMTGALLAQSGEFSFLLARIGSESGDVSESGFSAMLGAAVFSIAMSTPLYLFSRKAAAWLQPRLPARQDSVPENEPPDQLTGHVVVCGYGRVGRVIGEALISRHIPILVIEEDREVARMLAAEGIPVLAGSGDNPVLLEIAHLDRARALVVTVPDPVAARSIVDFGIAARAGLQVVVRTHSEAERLFLERRGASEAVLAEHELALEMLRRTLQSYKQEAPGAQDFVDELRADWRFDESQPN